MSYESDMTIINVKKPFIITYEITRPNNTTPYSVDDIINTDAVTTMPQFDFTNYDCENKIIELLEVVLLKSNNPSAGTDAFRLSIWNTNILGYQTYVDNDAQTPDYNECNGVADTIKFGLVETLFWTTIYKPIISPPTYFQLDGNFLNFTLVQLNAVTPPANGRYSITIKGVIT